MTSITRAGTRCVQELATFLGPLHSGGRCVLLLSCGTVAAHLTWRQCGKCGQEFKTKAELQCHQFSMHG